MVSISNLSKSVKRKMIFSKVSFDIEDGQMLAIVGNKGTGKTTLVKIITGYEHANEGTISIDGQNCTDNPAILRKCNAYIPVSQELYDKYPRQTLMENIKMFMHLNNLSLRDNMGTVSGLLDYFNLTTLEKVKLKKLNPIQQLKLSIARALIVNPRVLVLDEPFNNLNQDEILEAVNILDVFIQSGGSVVLTLTDIDLAAWLNCKVLILDGRTAVDGESYCRVYRNKNLPEDVEKEEQQEQYADDYYNDQYAGQYEYGYNNYNGDGDYNENDEYNNAEGNDFSDNVEDNDGNFDRVYGEEVNNEEYDQAFRGPSFNEQFGTGQIFDTVATESDEDDDSQDIVDNNSDEEPEDNEILDAAFFRNQDNFRNNEDMMNQDNFRNREDMRNQDNFRNHEDIRRQSIMRMQEEEQKRQEEERLRLEEEQKRQEEEERLRQEEEERRQEEERLRQEEEERRQEEERIRLEEEQREAERLRKEEEERLEELRRKEEEEAMPPRPELPPIRFTKTVEFFDNFGDVKEKRIGEEYFAVKDKMQGEEFLTKQFEALRILSNRRRELPQKED